MAVPVSMSVAFLALRRRSAGPTAYNAGFAVYWADWCGALPLWVMGPRTAARLLTTGRRPSVGDAALLALPVMGAVGTQLIPHRREIDAATAAVMVASAAVNAVGEELLWRGLFIREFAGRSRPAMLWSLVGFSVWHLAPQLILPSAAGRCRFVAGAAVVGTASTIVARRSRGLRSVVVAHFLTDACGVTAARFRLGR
ncbi:CPBP family intramembrane glutamic endopeptidase [Mycobacterium sp.]|uniref:CPBP family intramembrane glutamic endopeptidase n=1 Tax=Mycobacterium sp. TaxID=1785 RepID=UPI002BBAFF50|nr:CPBP family intramembrane glutamic endopeptidase [Mycobacterium sp.]HTY33572.1 CPBP family intramembrane glutamic endopeptidase [Mycobacterium sp.]